MNILILVFVLLVVFQIKHFIIDYPLQFARNDSMKKFDSEGWIFPLFKHATDHGLASALIVATVLFFAETALLPLILFSVATYLFDSVVHFTMDRIKASPNMLGKHHFPSKEYFYSLGIDQSVHHLTHYVIIVALVAYIYQ